MKTSSAPLLDLINSDRPFFKVDLYTITLNGGTVIRTSDADIDLMWAGVQFVHNAPPITRTKTKLSVGVEVDVMRLSVMTPTSKINGLSWNQAAMRGVLDGALVAVNTAYIETWPTIVGILPKFYGFVSNASPERKQVDVEVKSIMEYLSQMFPRNVYQSTCLRTVYTTGCGADKAAFTQTGAVTGSASQISFAGTIVGTARGDGWFDQGVLKFTSGALNNISRTIKSQAGGVFSFSNPFPSIPAVGNTYSMYAGCNRTRDVCVSKFNNVSHFRGMPYIPTPETTF